MQISKFHFVCAVALFGCVSVSVQAQDTSTEAKLREALRQKMAEDKAAEAAAAPSTAPAEKPAKRTRTTKTAAPASTPVAPAPAIVVAEPVVAPVAEVVAAPVVEPVAVAAPSTQEALGTVVTAGDDAMAARLRQALRESMGQGAASASVPTATTQPEVFQNTGVVSSSPTVVTAAPVVETAPALPISGSKVERLSALLQQYKANQITPQQYHEARAKIIAE